MKWSDVRRQWHEDVEYKRTLGEELPYRELAKAVASLRVRFELSQRQLAEKVGTTQSVISRLESGRHPVEIKMIRRIAEALGVKWRIVFGDDEQAAAADTRKVLSARLGAGGKRTEAIVYTPRIMKSADFATKTVRNFARSDGGRAGKIARRRSEGTRTS